MAARGYEFYLRVLLASLTSKRTSDRKFISPSGHECSVNFILIKFPCKKQLFHSLLKLVIG